MKALGTRRGARARYPPGLSCVYTGFAARELRNFQAAAEQTRGLSHTGTWHKVPGRSESIDPTADLFELSFVARQGARLANTIVIEDEPGSWETRIKALMLSIRERYPKDGQPQQWPRRDLRRGKLTGRFVYTDAGYPCLEASWDDPTKGTCTDVFVLSEDGAMMTQHTTYVRESNKQRTSYKTTWEKR